MPFKAPRCFENVALAGSGVPLSLDETPDRVEETQHQAKEECDDAAALVPDELFPANEETSPESHGKNETPKTPDTVPAKTSKQAGDTARLRIQKICAFFTELDSTLKCRCLVKECGLQIVCKINGAPGRASHTMRRHGEILKDANVPDPMKRQRVEKLKREDVIQEVLIEWMCQRCQKFSELDDPLIKSFATGLNRNSFVAEAEAHFQGMWKQPLDSMKGEECLHRIRFRLERWGCAR